MNRVDFTIRTADGRETTASLARAGMTRRGFKDMESYVADFIRRHAAVGNVVEAKGE